MSLISFGGNTADVRDELSLWTIQRKAVSLYRITRKDNVMSTPLYRRHQRDGYWRNWKQPAFSPKPVLSWQAWLSHLMSRL